MTGPSILGPTSKLLLLLLMCHLAFAVEVAEEKSEISPSESAAKPKLIPLFSVVRFPNDNCEGSTRNGTCYTEAECSNNGGSKDGDCASGFGVCCIFTLSCGQTSSENCTYLVQSATTSFTDTLCSYTICRNCDSVCRIRYDFTSMEINNKVTDTSGSDNLLVAQETGDCTSDTFSILGVTGPPIICGYNTGQHMIVDASSDCHSVNFNMDTASTASRKWDIKVTHYECGSEMGGPPGCLQYFTGTTGTVKNFGYPSTQSATTTHLSSQDYSMCWRRRSGYCYICWVPTITITGANTAAISSSFGISNSPNIAVASGVDGTCTTDYLEIADAVTAAIAAMTANIAGTQRICGRVFAPTDAQAVANTVSVCTRRTPFRMRFVTNDNEVTATTGTVTPATNENSGAPGGILGFSLNWVQSAC